MERSALIVLAHSTLMWRPAGVRIARLEPHGQPLCINVCWIQHHTSPIRPQPPTWYTVTLHSPSGRHGIMAIKQPVPLHKTAWCPPRTTMAKYAYHVPILTHTSIYWWRTAPDAPPATITPMGNALAQQALACHLTWPQWLLLLSPIKPFPPPWRQYSLLIKDTESFD